MASKTRKKIKQEVKRLVPAFEKEEPLSKDDITCKICFSIYLDPVTFPCNHSLCKTCFDTHIKETSLKCPFCNLRVSIWSRQAIKNNNAVNLLFKERIEQEFPQEIAALKRQAEAILDDEENVYGIRVADLSNILETSDGKEDELEIKVRDAEFCEPGEIAKDLEIIYHQHREELQKELQDEFNASQTLIEQIIKEEEDDEIPILSQIESDFQLAQRLQNENSPPNLRCSLPVTPPIAKAPLKNLAQTLISKNSSKKRRQSHPFPLPSKKRNKNSKAKPAKNESARQTKIVTYFSSSPQSPASFSSLFMSVPENANFIERKERVKSTESFSSKSVESISSSESGSSCSEWLPPRPTKNTSPALSQKTELFEEKPIVDEIHLSDPCGSTKSTKSFSSKSFESISSSESGSSCSEWLPPRPTKNTSPALSQKTELFEEKPIVDEIHLSDPCGDSTVSAEFLSCSSVSPELKSESDLNSSDSINDFAPDNNGNYIGLNHEDFEEPSDLLILMRNEDQRFLEEKRRQEEADLKLAMELQASYESGTARGRKGSTSQKYSLRNWMRWSQV